MKTNLLFFLILITFISCKKKEGSDIPMLRDYPMKVGSQWYYDRQVILREYISETSSSVIYSDTTNSQMIVWIEKDTVLKDTMTVKVIRTKEIGGTYTLNPYTYTFTQYKYLDSIGIKNYAYINPGRPNISAKQSRFIASKNGILINELMCKGLYSTEKIITEPNPTLDIKLPLDQNTSWTAMSSRETNQLQIKKSAVGIDYLKLANPYPCYKVSWQYLNDPYFENTKVIEWISTYGLMKRQAIYNKVLLTNESGTLIEGTFQIEEIITINSMLTAL